MDRKFFTHSKDLDFLIFNHLDDRSLIRISKLNKYFLSLYNDDELWKRRFMIYFPSKKFNKIYEIKPNDKSWKEYYFILPKKYEEFDKLCQKGEIELLELFTKYYDINWKTDNKDIVKKICYFIIIAIENGQINICDLIKKLIDFPFPELFEYVELNFLLNYGKIINLKNNLETLDYLNKHFYIDFEPLLYEIIRYNNMYIFKWLKKELDGNNNNISINPTYISDTIKLWGELVEILIKNDNLDIYKLIDNIPYLDELYPNSNSRKILIKKSKKYNSDKIHNYLKNKNK